MRSPAGRGGIRHPMRSGASLDRSFTPSGSSETERFMRLFLAHQRRFYGLILSLVPNVTDADDLLQETAALMWQKFAEFRPGTDFAAWGLRFARNLVSNHRKKTRRLAGRVNFSE